MNVRLLGCINSLPTMTGSGSDTSILAVLVGNELVLKLAILAGFGCCGRARAPNKGLPICLPRRYLWALYTMRCHPGCRCASSQSGSELQFGEVANLVEALHVVRPALVLHPVAVFLDAAKLHDLIAGQSPNAILRVVAVASRGCWSSVLDADQLEWSAAAEMIECCCAVSASPSRDQFCPASLSAVKMMSASDS